MTKIRELNEEDIPAVLEIDRLSFSKMEEEAFFKNPNKKYLAAKIGDKIAGYLVYEKVLDEVHILRFAVHPDFRRKGIGRSLLKEVFNHGKRFFLEVRKSNLASQRLCESLGFRVVGERKRYYADNGEDALVMTNLRSPSLLGPLPPSSKYSFFKK